MTVKNPNENSSENLNKDLNAEPRHEPHHGLRYAQGAAPTVLLYSADVWEHVCPMVRLVGPLAAAGIRIVHGVRFDTGGGLLEPVESAAELMDNANVVVIARDFARYPQLYSRVLAAARAAGKPVIYDLDDLLCDLPTSHPDYPRYRESRAAIIQAVIQADWVTCSTAALAQELALYNDRIHVLPNTLLDALWPLAVDPATDASANTDVHATGAPADEENHAESDEDSQEENAASQRTLVIGYAGGGGHADDVAMIIPALTQLQERYGARLAFRFWGLQPPAELKDAIAANPDMDVETALFWDPVGLVSYTEYAHYFRRQQCDIFIAPLQDNRFNRSKSGLKYLEYSALGIPGVYSRLEPYATLVRHGETGLLAGSVEEWRDALAALVNDAALRRRLGHAARADVEANWRLSQHAERWRDFYAMAAHADTGPVQAVAPRLEHMAELAVVWSRELEENIDRQSRALQTRRREIQELEQQLHAADARAEQLRQEIRRRDEEIQELHNWIGMMTNSVGWKLMQALTPWRYRLFPLGSRRERALQLGAHSFGVLTHEGPISFARKTTRELRRLRQRGHLQDRLGHLFPALWTAGAPCPAPAISVVLMHNGDHDPDIQSVERWASNQTLPATHLEVAVWDRQTATATLLGDPSETWDAPTADALLDNLNGRYLLVLPGTLPAGHTTYLEEALLVLESEALAFVVSADAPNGAIYDLLRGGKLPGSPEQPLHKTLVRRDCLDDRLQIALESWQASRDEETGPDGKMIFHTTSAPVDAREVPEQAPPEGMRLHTAGTYLFLRPTGEAFDPSAESHSLRPLSPILPAGIERDPRSTVLLFSSVLAVGGAEQVHLYMLEQLKDEIRFVVVATDAHETGVGTSADRFREYTPYVYTTADFLLSGMVDSFFDYLIQRYSPETFYIFNGNLAIYEMLPRLKAMAPHLRIVGQVYDHQAGWINRYTPDLVALFDGHIGTNSLICEEFVRRGADPATVHLVEHCVDVRMFDPARYDRKAVRAIRQALGIPAENRVVTFMARLHAQKRPMDYAELARQFADDPSITFLLIGDGPLAPQVDAELARVGLRNVIRRPFYRPSSDIFAISDVYVLPSEYEGMPLVILEAQAMGVPVVVTDAGNNRAVLEITQGGVVVDRIGDIAGLHAAVQQMLATPPAPDALRKAVLEELSQVFGILPEQMAEKYRRALLASPHSTPQAARANDMTSATTGNMADDMTDDVTGKATSPAVK